MEIFKQQLLTTLDEMCKSNNIRVTTAPITKQNDVELTAIYLTPEEGNMPYLNGYSKMKLLKLSNILT